MITDNDVVLAVSSSYDRKYYFNPDFDALPEGIKEDIQVMMVMFTMEIGGILTIAFDEDGQMLIETESDDEDILYDEIGAHLKVKQMTKEKAELFEGLEMFFRVFYLGEDLQL